MSYLLDTNVVSELRKRSPDSHVIAWLDAVSSDELFISVLTIGAIRLGIERLRRKDEAQAQHIEHWLTGLREIYADRIIDLNEQTAQEWGRINVPDPLPIIDGLLAATARTWGLTLVTRNIADLATSGAALINPFEP